MPGIEHFRGMDEEFNLTGSQSPLTSDEPSHP